MGVVFGGPSREHGVSFLSARCLLENLPPEKYEAIPVFVGKDGLWNGPKASKAEMERQLARPAKDLLLDGVKAGSRPARTAEIVDSFFSAWHAAGADVLFPIVHGTFGEDGVVQGLFEALGVPYVGCGVAASAVGMDKIFMKAAFAAAGLPQVKYVGFSRAEWASKASRAALVTRIGALGLPIFVKPACAGSSVGVSKVKDEAGLATGGRRRAPRRRARARGAGRGRARDRVLRPRGRERRPTEASLPGEIVPGHEFYDYEDKYIDAGSRASFRPTCPRATARSFAASPPAPSTSSAARASPAWTSSSSAGRTGSS